jgi:hypothetical protein
LCSVAFADDDDECEDPAFAVSLLTEFFRTDSDGGDTLFDFSEADAFNAAAVSGCGSSSNAPPDAPAVGLLLMSPGWASSEVVPAADANAASMAGPTSRLDGPLDAPLSCPMDPNPRKCCSTIDDDDDLLGG